MALTADDRLFLINIKLDRAEKHLRDLAADILGTKDVTIVSVDSDPHLGYAGKFSAGFPMGHKLITVPQLDVAVVASAGDLVHNLRSSLDHIAYQLAWVNLGTEPEDPLARKIGFPIAETFEKYESEKTRKIQGCLRLEAIEAIDALQPYKGGCGDGDALWRLHDLDNIDKHRALFSVTSDYLLFSEWTNTAYRVKTDSPNFAGFEKHVNQDANLATEEPVMQPQIARSDALLPALRELFDVVKNIILGFKPLLE